MVCRDFILPEFCKPCLFLFSIQFAQLIVLYLLGVLADYFRLAGIACVLLIIISCAFLIPANMDLSSNYLLYLLRCGSAFSYAIFAGNILLLWLILIFLVNSLGKSVK